MDVKLTLFLKDVEPGTTVGALLQKCNVEMTTGTSLFVNHSKIHCNGEEYFRELGNNDTVVTAVKFKK